MKFAIKPTSGHSDSYFDIEFNISFDSPQTGYLEIYNKTNSQILNILSVSSGKILHENKIEINNETILSGFINLFNDDKMNTGLSLYNNVTISCVFKSKTNEPDIEKECIFYNESNSVDRNVIPVDVYIENRSLDISSGMPLHINFVANRVFKYEFCIKNKWAKKEFTFEVITKKGSTSINIPSEMLYFDLGIQQGSIRDYSLFYTKFEGTTYSKVLNRKYIEIPDVSIKISCSSGICLSPQSRKNLFLHLSDDFILSDRYFVYVPRKFSSFSKKTDYSRDKLLNMTMFIHESQHMKMIQQKLSMSASHSDIDNTNKNIKETHKKIQEERTSKTSVLSVNEKKRMLFNTMSTMQTSKFSTHSLPHTKEKANNMSSFSVEKQEKKSCLPCSRKKKKSNDST